MFLVVTNKCYKMLINNVCDFEIDCEDRDSMLMLKWPKKDAYTHKERTLLDQYKFIYLLCMTISKKSVRKRKISKIDFQLNGIYLMMIDYQLNVVSPLDKSSVK